MDCLQERFSRDLPYNTSSFVAYRPRFESRIQPNRQPGFVFTLKLSSQATLGSIPIRDVVTTLGSFTYERGFRQFDASVIYHPTIEYSFMRAQNTTDIDGFERSLNDIEIVYIPGGLDALLEITSWTPFEDPTSVRDYQDFVLAAATDFSWRLSQGAYDLDYKSPAGEAGPQAHIHMKGLPDLCPKYSWVAYAYAWNDLHLVFDFLKAYGLSNVKARFLYKEHRTRFSECFNIDINLGSQLSLSSNLTSSSNKTPASVQSY